MLMPRHQIVLSTLVILLLAGMSLLWLRNRRIQEQWQQMLDQVEQARLELVEREDSRPVLWGEAEEGRAFDFYEKIPGLMAQVVVDEAELLKKLGALAAEEEKEDGPEISPHIQKMLEDLQSKYREEKGDVWVLSSLLNHFAAAKKPMPAELLELLEKLQPVFDALHKGAHQLDPRRQVHWKTEFEYPLAKLCRDISYLAVLRIRALVEAGKDRQAAQLTLDLLQLSRDVMEQAEFHSLSAASMIWPFTEALFLRPLYGEDHDRAFRDEGRPALILDDLSPESINQIRLGLDRLERPLSPIHRQVLASAVLLGVAGAGDVDSKGFILFGGEMGNICEAVDFLCDLSELYREPGNSWKEFLLVRIEKVPVILEPVSENKWVMFCTPILDAEEGTRLLAIANLRLLHLVLDDLVGESGSYEDPFGGKLQARIANGQKLYWSRGDDGEDNGGDPDRDQVFVGE